MPRARLQALCETPPARSKRRPLVRYAVAAMCWRWYWPGAMFSGLNQPTPYTAGKLSTALANGRQVALPDGSVIDLNSRQSRSGAL